MNNKRAIEITVGMFMVGALAAMLALALQVSGLTQRHTGRNHYNLIAEFDNIGSLKVRAPVRIAGVKVGRVGAVVLDPNNYRAKVILWIDNNQKLPVDTSASILTEGLLGANYVALNPGYQKALLKMSGWIHTTHSAMVLERLIGQFIFNTGARHSDKKQG